MCNYTVNVLWKSLNWYWNTCNSSIILAATVLCRTWRGFPVLIGSCAMLYYFSSFLFRMHIIDWACWWTSVVTFAALRRPVDCRIIISSISIKSYTHRCTLMFCVDDWAAETEAKDWISSVQVCSNSAILAGAYIIDGRHSRQSAVARMHVSNTTACVTLSALRCQQSLCTFRLTLFICWMNLRARTVPIRWQSVAVNFTVFIWLASQLICTKV